MTLLQAIQMFFRGRQEPTHLQDLYAALPEEHEHSLRARIYENLGKHFKRVGHGIYVAIEGDATCVVVHGDAWEKVKEIPSRSIDAVITDPPYRSIDQWIGKGSTRPRMRWDFERKDIDLELGRELYRVLKEGAHAFFFVPALTATTERHLDLLRERLKKCGFRLNKLWVWDKVHPGMGYSGRARYEGILFMSKGRKRQPCDLSIPDVIASPLIASHHRKHPTEKPAGVLEPIIKFATKVGELILDPFAGSCSTGKTALRLGRSSLLIEKSESILQGGIA